MQALRQSGIVSVKAQADDVNGFTGKGDRNLGAGEVRHALCLGGCHRTVLAANFIVVSQRPQFDAIGFGTLSQDFRRQGAVGDDGMAMQVGVENIFRMHENILCFQA